MDSCLTHRNCPVLHAAALLEYQLFDEMPRNPDSSTDASGSGRRADMTPVLRNPSAGRWINELHRGILLRILSHLYARQAVQTWLLSLQWRGLWRDASRLNASCDEFELPDIGGYDVRTLRFKKFINRLLMLRNPVALDDFRLSYSFSAGVEGDGADADLWVGHALLCGARSVEVGVTDESDRLRLDPALLTSKHLTSLRFHSVRLDRGFFRQLQTGCPVLEVLILQDCAINDINIFSQTLKSLSIGRNCFFNFIFHHQASISAPSLTHFGLWFGQHHFRIPLLKNMESLETAYISLNGFQVGVQIDDDIRQFFMGLSGVTTLDFYYVGSEVCFFISHKEIFLS
jgi:hypothetical protein